MIELNELVFSKKLVKITTRKVFVNMDNVLYMYPSSLSYSAPTEVASKIFGDNIPDEYYKVVDKCDCTTIKFVGDSEMDVKESAEEIISLTKLCNQGK